MKLYTLLSPVTWDIISKDVSILAGATSCKFECLGEVAIIRTENWMDFSRCH